MAKKLSAPRFVDADVELEPASCTVMARDAASIRIRLPKVTHARAGITVTVKNVNCASVKLVGFGQSTIDSLPSFSLKKKTAVTVIADDAGNWYVISATA